MTKEQLLAAGFTEEQATNILKLYKEAIDGNYVPKHRFDEVNAELKTTKEQVKERDTQIKELKKFEGDSKALQDKIAELEAANADKDKEYQSNLALERKKNAIRLALLEDENGKPYDAEMVMGLFNLEQVLIDEATGKITSGYKEQNEALRKEKAFLFSPKEDINKGGDGKPAGWKPQGQTPPDGNGGQGGTDPSISYGKSLAQIKLGMMGIKPAGAEGSNNQ
jgi:hypothetical protein